MKILEENGNKIIIESCYRCVHVGVDWDYKWSCYYDGNDVKVISVDYAEFEKTFMLKIPDFCKLKDE